jgi:hypothetical protein
MECQTGQMLIDSQSAAMDQWPKTQPLFRPQLGRASQGFCTGLVTAQGSSGSLHSTDFPWDWSGPHSTIF